MKSIDAQTLSNISFDDFLQDELILEDRNIVLQILKDIKQKGDKALRFYNHKFDHRDTLQFQILPTEITAAYNRINPNLRKSLEKAINNVTKFAQLQRDMYKEFNTQIGNFVVGQKIIPIERVGCYIPGGNYPLISSIYMTVIPAKIAGVSDIYICCPRCTDEILATAKICGVDTVFQIGGAQAIAAMAYGTNSIPKVDKIVGPGNKYVTFAKKTLIDVVGIDMIAGPSEILIIADKSADAKLVTADLIAQAEHDIAAKCYLISVSRDMKQEIECAIESLLTIYPEAKERERVLSVLQNSLLFQVDSVTDAANLSNQIAPEHLELHLNSAEKYIDLFQNYGSLFVGNETAEVFGDYFSGTNHVLPTSRVARHRGGLSVGDFLKIQTYQNVKSSLSNEAIGNTALLAEVEGLQGHKNAAILRKSQLMDKKN